MTKTHVCAKFLNERSAYTDRTSCGASCIGVNWKLHENIHIEKTTTDHPYYILGDSNSGKPYERLNDVGMVWIALAVDNLDKTYT